MQKQSLIPTPLNPTHSARKPIEIVEPKLPSRLRIFQILFFILSSVARAIAAKLFGRWAKDRYSTEASARRLRAFMEKMGGLWVKAGQIVALRRDLFSETFCAELSRLQDRARGFPGTQARKIVETELGKSIDEVFAEFDLKPLAAASIGQAHRALLKTSKDAVVVKVRRPHIAESFQIDLRIFRIYVELLTWANIMPQFRWRDLYSELESSILEELDYRQEAASLRRMRKNLRSQKIYVPKVFLEFCTDQVLVMEMVQGVYMSEYLQVAATNPAKARAWLKENKINARAAGERLLFSHYQQMFEDNLYHCDLHPGNILLMRENRITLIDFGSVGSMDKSQLTKFLQLFRAVATRDYQKAADLWFLLCPALPDKDLTGIKAKIVQMYREFEPLTKIKTLPYHQKSVGKLAGLIIEILGNAGVAIPWDMLRSTRAELTLDASLMFLLPGIDYPKTIRTYLRKLRTRMQKKFQSSKATRVQLAKLSESIDLPVQLAENAYFEGEYLRRRAMKYEGFLSKGAQIGASLFVLLSRGWVLVALAAGLAALHQKFDALRALRGTWAYSLLQRIPPHGPTVWILCMLAALYIRREFVQITQVLEQAEPTRASGDRR